MGNTAEHREAPVKEGPETPQRIGDYATIRMAVEETGYSGYWIRQLCRSGDVDAIKLGHERRGQWMVNLESLEKYAEEKSEEGYGALSKRR